MNKPKQMSETSKVLYDFFEAREEPLTNAQKAAITNYMQNTDDHERSALIKAERRFYSRTKYGPALLKSIVGEAEEKAQIEQQMQAAEEKKRAAASMHAALSASPYGLGMTQALAENFAASVAAAGLYNRYK